MQPEIDRLDGANESGIHPSRCDITFHQLTRIITPRVESKLGIHLLSHATKSSQLRSKISLLSTMEPTERLSASSGQARSTSKRAALPIKRTCKPPNTTLPLEGTVSNAGLEAKFGGGPCLELPLASGRALHSIPPPVNSFSTHGSLKASIRL